MAAALPPNTAMGSMPDNSSRSAAPSAKSTANERPMASSAANSTVTPEQPRRISAQGLLVGVKCEGEQHQHRHRETAQSD